MAQSYIGNFLEFIISLGFSLYIFLVLLRFLLQLVRADFRNPVAQMLLVTTNPLLRPLRRIIPGWGGIDLAALILLVFLQVIQLTIIGLLPNRSMVMPPGLFLLVLGLLIDHVVWLYFFTVTIQVVISWINPMAYHQPIGVMLLQLNEPLLRPLRRKFSMVNGLDISPILFMVILMAIHFLVAAPLIDQGALPHGYL
ncbi:MAG: YggT family protein [Gammaproteobacteria bacterium]|nr:YggT family protein [Gammaproteobacteria bacterium]